MKIVLGKLSTLLLILIAASTARAQDFVFETDFARYVVNRHGDLKSLSDKASNREWLASTATPFATITKAGTVYPISGLRRKESVLEASFGQSGIQADYKITVHQHYLTIELLSLRGQDIHEVTLMQLKPIILENNGQTIACRWSDKFSICLMALSDRVNSELGQENLILSSVYPEFGLRGEGVALIAAPTSEFLKVVQEVERDNGLPSPKIGGYWAKQSPNVQTSYLFTDLTETNAEETIKYAKLGGFQYILIYCSTWASSFGSYQINRGNFPRGEESLRATIDKCHAAGLKVGMHMMTSLIAKDDPLVCPNPNSRILKDATTTLASNLSSSSNEIDATKQLSTLITGQPLGGLPKGGVDIQIDNEIIHCNEAGGTGNPGMVFRCIRGYAGTKAAPHQAGAKLYRLAERFGCYLADLKTSLKDEIADCVAGLINRCGFDMIYFDGGEANDANGPMWYWVSQQQLSILKRVNREVLVQGSEMTHWTWHLFSRFTCDDYAAIWPTHWLDYYKVGTLKSLRSDFMPAELGWCGLLDDSPDHPATLPDEMEHYGIRMLAYNVPVSIETSLKMLKSNGRTEKIFEKLYQLERLRLGMRIPPETQERLRKGDWQIVQNGDKSYFCPLYRQMKLITLPAVWDVDNLAPAQPLQFRLTALSSLARTGDLANIVLFSPDDPVELKLPPSIQREIGVLAAQVNCVAASKQQGPMQQSSPEPLASTPAEGVPLDLHRHRGLAVSLRVQGLPTAPDKPSAVLNVQLEAAGNMYRDYYVDLDFEGEKTIILPETNAEELLTQFKPTGYAAFNSMYDFDYRKIVALNFRWMRLPKDLSFSCSVRRVEALAETNSTITGLEIGLRDRLLTIPMQLHSGNYLEMVSGNQLGLFDQNGNLLSSIKTNPDRYPILEPGDNRITLRSSTPCQVRLMIMTLGNRDETVSESVAGIKRHMHPDEANPPASR